MFDFAQSIRDRRPKLRDTSVSAYATSLKTLAPEGGENIQDLSFLKDTKQVLSKLEKYKPNTRKNHLNAAVVVLQESTDPEFVAAVKIYEGLRDKYQEEYLDQVKTHQKTPSQEANWIEWPEYELMVGHMADGVKWRGEMTGKEKMRYQEYLVALLHLNFPVRNDFHGLVVVTMGEWRDLPALEQTKRNYYIHGQNLHRFVLNQYKTSDKYGQRVLEVKGEALAKALRRWNRVNQSPHFLRNSKGVPLDSNGITKTLGRVGQREKGKTLGSSILRHSYLSHKYHGAAQEKEKDAALMMHSVETQGDYIKTGD